MEKADDGRERRAAAGLPAVAAAPTFRPWRATRKTLRIAGPSKKRSLTGRRYETSGWHMRVRSGRGPSEPATALRVLRLARYAVRAVVAAAGARIARAADLRHAIVLRECALRWSRAAGGGELRADVGRCTERPYDAARDARSPRRQAGNRSGRGRALATGPTARRRSGVIAPVRRRSSLR